MKLPVLIEIVVRSVELSGIVISAVILLSAAVISVIVLVTSTPPTINVISAGSVSDLFTISFVVTSAESV